MQKFSMTCTCGHVMDVDAETREDAVAKMKATMNEEAVAQHMAEKHPGEPPMTVAQVHAGIEASLAPAGA